MQNVDLAATLSEYSAETDLHAARSERLSRRLYLGIFKRVFDIFFALLTLPFLAPIIAAIWVLVRLDGGAGFFGHSRIGRNGKVFKCMKIRTMVPDAEAQLKLYLAANPEAAAGWARDFKLDHDPRITRIGQFLRKSSLDELPQIWNVLRGEMSFVGPRPVTAPELELYGSAARIYEQMRPGITGLWQVSGRNDISYAARVALDVRYFRTASLSVDIATIVATARAVLHMTGK